MSYPGTVTLDISKQVLENDTVGPFLVNGALYLFLNNTTVAINKWAVNCYKSLDLGQTWTQIGGDSAQFGNNVQLCCVRVGTTIYCCTLDNVGPDLNIVLIPFDTIFETFGALIDSGVSTLNGSPANEFYAAGYRASDTSILFCYLDPSNPSPTRLFCFAWNVGSQTSGVPFPVGDGAAITDWDCAAVLVGSTFSTFLFRTNDGAGNTTLVTQSLSATNALGALTPLDSGGSSTYEILWSNEGDIISVGWTPDNSGFNPVTKLFTGLNTEPFAGTEQDYVYSEGTATLDNPSVSSVRVSGTNFLFLDGNTGPGNPDGYVVDAGAFVTLNNPGTYNTPLAFSPGTGFWSVVQFDVNTGAVLFFFGGSAPPPVATGGLVRLKTPEPASLPDPKILCNYSHPKPCGEELDCRNYQIQGTKGVYGSYKR